MASKKRNYPYDTTKYEGVWRTIGGRKVYIKTGQSLSEAMRESGKFEKTASGNIKREDIVKVKQELHNRELHKQTEDMMNAYGTNRYKFGSNYWGDKYRQASKYEREGKELLDSYYDNPIEAKDTYDLVGQHINKNQQLGDIGRKVIDKKKKILSGDKGLSSQERKDMSPLKGGKLYSELTDQEKELNEELHLRDMAMSSWIYGGDLHTDKDVNSAPGNENYYNKPYINKFYDKLGKDRTEEILKQQKDYFNRGKVQENVYTDSEGLSYNSFIEPKNSKERDLSVKYDSVEDRYNKDKSFRDMLKNEHNKTLDTTRKEINSYFDMTLEDRKKLVGDENDLYKALNEDYGNIDRDEFDKIYKEELLNRTAKDVAKSFGADKVKVKDRTYEQVDGEWQELAKKMEKDYDEYGTTNWRDEKRLNELSRERDTIQFKDKKTGNDYLPKASKVEKSGTSNRKEVSDNIQAHILEYYDNPVDFMEQMDAMDWLPTRWRAGEELASGGSYLIYYDDQREFLNSLNINPKGKEFSDDRVFQTYNSLIGRESERLYNRLQKLYEQYQREHKDSNVSLDDFRKWFK